MELKSSTPDAYRTPPRVFYFNGADFVRRRRDLALWSTSSLRLAATATARNADQHITRRNVGARTHVLSRRYGGANCNLCLIAIVVGAPRQRELCRRRSFLRFKTFQECHHHSRQKTPWLHHASRWCKSRLRGSYVAHRFHQSARIRNVEITDEMKHRCNQCPIYFLSIHSSYSKLYKNFNKYFEVKIYFSWTDILLIYRSENLKTRYVALSPKLNINFL